MHSIIERPKRTPTMLVIDDEFPILELLSEALEEEGFQITVAGDLQLALALLDRQQFDLVLADSLASFNAAGLNIWSALEAVLERAALARVVIFSAHPPRYFADLHERGFAGYVAKPFDLDLLALMLRAFLSSGSISHAGVL